MENAKHRVLDARIDEFARKSKRAVRWVDVQATNMMFKNIYFATFLTAVCAISILGFPHSFVAYYCYKHLVYKALFCISTSSIIAIAVAVLFRERPFHDKL